MIKKRNDGKWDLNIRLGGATGKQIKKIFRTQNEAKNFEVWAKGQHQKNIEWQPQKQDPRKLSELINIWWNFHGITLSAGKNTLSRLQGLCSALGNPFASNLQPETFSEYRQARIKKGIAHNTINREHAYLRSVFNELTRLGEWKKANPLKEIRQFKIQQKELSFLSHTEIKQLFDSLTKSRNPHALLITKICLSTGARWSEAENLKIQHVKNSQIQFVETKSKKVRSVAITPELEKQILEHAAQHLHENRIFQSAFSAFREAIDRAKLELPTGQLTHILRHTFASHFIMNGGNILALQKILGHSTLTMTIRYAHLAPEHLAEARSLNPLAKC